MERSRVKIAIVESSEILRIGVEHIVDSSPLLTLSYSEESLPATQSKDIDAVIINVDTLTRGGQQRVSELFPNAEIIALVYRYITRAERALLDEVIEICDSPERVVEVLLKNREFKVDKSSAKVVDSGELSEREMEVVAAVARGLINKEIADSLNISIHTVMAHRKNISRKTGIRSISGLVVYALLNGLIEQSEVLR